MKRLFIVTLVFLSIGLNAQTKDSIPPTTEPLISIKQINEVLTEMRKGMTIEMTPVYTLLLQQLQAKIDEGIVEWRKKLKKNK